MKIKQIKPKDLLKALLKLGFLIKRRKGSHIFLERNLRNQKNSLLFLFKTNLFPKVH
ncbi:MAG: type II toxin-antitoxin system HicA family toxin [Microgenomates group bacterium]